MTFDFNDTLTYDAGDGFSIFPDNPYQFIGLLLLIIGLPLALMFIQRNRILRICSLLIFSLLTLCEEYPVRPYIDPSHLDVPWPGHSFYKIPWRAFLETKSGYDFLQGIGINYNVPENEELAIRLLAEAGFKTFRIEIGWGSLSWDEKGLNNQEHIEKILALCKKYSIRPTILLNAHHGVPCPTQFFTTKLLADAPKGSRTVRLADVSQIIPRRSGLSNLTDYWAGEVLITQIDESTGECQLSKPLPKDLKAGDNLLIATLKYLPLHPLGTKEFEETADGWVKYALIVCDLVKKAGLNSFDIEIWNELTFGSNFLERGINNYYDPPIVEFKVNFLHPGGHAWELARRTVSAIKEKYPQVRCIWGFSNTTFFHTPIEELPPMTDGQSYHPYGTGTRRFPQDEQYRDKPELNVDGYSPQFVMRMPEGWAHTFLQTESLMRLLNPTARLRHPPKTERFYHYMTEHGVLPPECGVNDEEKAWLLKAKTVLRSFCFWLNKGIDAMHYFCAYDPNPLGMGLLPTNLSSLPKEAEFQEVATLPLRALKNLVSAFRDSVPLKETDKLEVDVIGLGKQGIIFEGNREHPPLRYPDVFAFLPFQIDEQSYIIAVYVMTYDATEPMKEERYRLQIKGFKKPIKQIRLYDPLTNKYTPLKVIQRGKSITIEIPLVDYPRLLRLS